jgi:hypothetical protein
VQHTDFDRAAAREDAGRKIKENNKEKSRSFIHKPPIMTLKISTAVYGSPNFQRRGKSTAIEPSIARYEHFATRNAESLTNTSS